MNISTHSFASTPGMPCSFTRSSSTEEAGSRFLLGPRRLRLNGTILSMASLNRTLSFSRGGTSGPVANLPSGVSSEILCGVTAFGQSILIGIDDQPVGWDPLSGDLPIWSKSVNLGKLLSGGVFLDRIGESQRLLKRGRWKQCRSACSSLHGTRLVAEVFFAAGLLATLFSLMSRSI